MTYSKSNRVQVLQEHKKMIESAIAQFGGPSNDADATKLSNKKKSLEEQLEKVNKQLAGEKKSIQDGLKEADKI